MTLQPEDIVDYRIRLLGGLRAFGANYAEFTRRFAKYLGLHSTDAAALVEILYAEDSGAPLSPARLAERISLSSGATNAVLNRLENAGHVVRSREHADRRIVTLHSSVDIQGPAIAFFTPLSQHLDAMLIRYSSEQLDQFEAFLDQLRTSTTDALAEPDPEP